MKKNQRIKIKKSQKRDFRIIIKSVEEVSGEDYLLVAVVVVNDDYYNDFVWSPLLRCCPKQDQLGNTFFVYVETCHKRQKLQLRSSNGHPIKVSRGESLGSVRPIQIKKVNKAIK